jgi:myo-inositol-1(or 4)-monophosphatase
MKEFLEKTIREAGELAKGYFEKGVTHTWKSNPGDFLTEADTAVSTFLVDAIHAQYTTHHIKSEELREDINPGAEYEWIIDPIDGTRNFATGIPLWGIIIAVMQNGTALHGAVYFPISDYLFFATKGEGAYMNGKRVVVSQTTVLDHATGNLYRAPDAQGPYGQHIAKFRTVSALIYANTNLRCTNFGCAAYISFLANGSLDFAIGNSGLDWDYIAPFLICEEAGAVITDSEGNPWTRGRQDYIIANPDVHPKLMEFFQPPMV